MNGTLGFSLVSVPIKMYTATGPDEVKFHQVHREDGGRIRYRKFCEIDGNEIAQADIGRGIEIGDQTVQLTDDDLDALPRAAAKRAEIILFIPAGQVPELALEKAYYIEPEEAGVRAYGLLRDGMARAGRVALVRLAMRSEGRESLALLRAEGDMLVLQFIVWPEEIREPAFRFRDQPAEATPAEAAMADALIAAMSGDYQASDYHSEYRVAVNELAAAKLAGVQAEQPEQAQPGPVLDLTAALQASVDAATQRQEAA
jgi:DNA end-binding protein Ku